jgi:hypothetical protein
MRLIKEQLSKRSIGSEGKTEEKMGLSNKVNQLVSSVQIGAKNTSFSVFNWFLKGLTAFLVALTMAMIGQELISYGTFSFVFVMVVVIATLMRIMKKWAVGAVLIFDLICILVALLLRMYIIVAP